MSGIGGIVRWDGGPVAEPELRTMMRLVAHRGPDRLTWRIGDGVGLGHALQAMRRCELDQRPQPVSLPDGAYSIVADARIDNRDDLARGLGSMSWFNDRPSDAELILAGFERWGDDVVHRIEGDFAFAIWQPRPRRLFAARDPFGVRPLFYRWDSTGLLFGSEPKQILALPDVPVEVDDQVVSEFLLLRFHETGRTFFEGVRKLPPAHVLTASAEGAAIRRYWRPEDDPDDGTVDPGLDLLERFRELLVRSVDCRLDTDFPVAAHLSGGIDSSSVVVAAAEACRRRTDGLPNISTVSAVFPGLDCDETALIQAVSRRVPFRSLTYRPDASNLLEDLQDELWTVDSPFVGVIRSAWRSEAELLTELGARSLLTGLGGDELLDDSNVLADLVRRRRYGRWLRELWSSARTPTGSPWHALLAAARWSVPVGARRMLDAWRSRRSRNVATWADSGLARRLATHDSAAEQSAGSSTDLTARSIVGYLARPHLVWGVEATNLRCASVGVDAAHPFLDRPLAEFVVHLPLEARLPHGQQKALARRALAEQLPVEVRELGARVGYDQAIAQTLAAWWQVLPEALGAPDTWQIARLLDCSGFRALCDTVLSRSDAGVAPMEELWRIAMVELWMRGLRRYNQVER